LDHHAQQTYAPIFQSLFAAPLFGPPRRLQLGTSSLRAASPVLQERFGTSHLAHCQLWLSLFEGHRLTFAIHSVRHAALVTRLLHFHICYTASSCFCSCCRAERHLQLSISVALPRAFPRPRASRLRCSRKVAGGGVQQRHSAAASAAAGHLWCAHPGAGDCFQYAVHWHGIKTVTPVWVLWRMRQI